MSNVALEMDHVYKKFKKGEIYDCLRDLIPALFGKMLKGSTVNALGESEFWATEDVSFQVNRGEALGIIGSNGAGKSTILKLLCGIMKPTKGVLRVNGKLSALIEVGAGFHGDLTGRENVFLNGTILGMKKEEISRKFDEIVEFSGLGDFIDTPVKRYSSGMYARLGFSVAAHVDPEILIVDEVLSVGDVAFQNKCMEKMKSIVRSGTSVIFVSHNLKAVMDLCDRCILLDHGNIQTIGPANEVVTRYLNPGKWKKDAHEGKECYVSKVEVKKNNSEMLVFDSGEKATVEIEVTGNTSCKNLSVTIGLLNNDELNVFNTSTQRLNFTSFSLNPGEKKTIIFELNLHLVPGAYHIGVQILQHDTQKSFDVLYPAATIQVRSEKDVLGVANLYPKAITDTSIDATLL
jgi:ABC-type polysaccharide/polyol phosphate transport system ATPase subunit